jgi:hypothetical protein
MNKNVKQRILIILVGCLLAIALIGARALSAYAADRILIGEVNDTCQLVANGEIYDIADTPKGRDLARNYISQKVKVTGTIEPGSELKIIVVRTFEVVDE